MYKRVRLLVIFIVFFVVLANVSTGESLPESTGGADGRVVKLRILLDKVMQPEEGWTTKEWMVKEAADAGFNVFTPRKGYDNLDEVEQVVKWCEKYGISYMPWMRGTMDAPINTETDGKRYIPGKLTKGK